MVQYQSGTRTNWRYIVAGLTSLICAALGVAFTQLALLAIGGFGGFCLIGIRFRIDANDKLTRIE